MHNSQLQDYDELIDLVYATSTNSDLWPDLLESLDKHAEKQQGKTNLSIAKHIERSTNLAHQHDVLVHENELLMCIINRLPIGVIVVQNDSKVVAINDRAQNLLAKNKSLCIHNNILQAYNKRETLHLNACIQEQMQHHAYSGKPHTIQKDKEVTPLSLWVSPSSYDLPNHQNLVSIYIASSEIRLSLSIDTLMSMYQLTHTEAKFTQVISNGCHNVRDAAKASDISYETARTYIKRIFQKTNTHNQTELIKLLLTSPAALIGEAQTPKAHVPVTTAPPSMNKSSFQLSNGRRIGYVEYGDPDGDPVIYCHSLIHPDEQMFHKKEMEEQLKYRIISPKRPGFLNSSPMDEHCTLQQHASDIIELTDHLNIDTFKVLAHSNGCPYAAALAHDYPNRVKKLLLVSPFVPPSMDDISSLKNIDRVMYKVARYLPNNILNHLTRVTIQNMANHPDTFFKENTKHASLAEQAFIGSQELIAYAKLWIDATYPKRIQAVSQDLFVRVRNWGFEPENIRTPVVLWHAEDDTTIKSTCAKQLAFALPNCHENYLKHGGHYIFFTHFNEITKDF